MPRWQIRRKLGRCGRGIGRFFNSLRYPLCHAMELRWLVFPLLRRCGWRWCTILRRTRKYVRRLISLLALLTYDPKNAHARFGKLTGVVPPYHFWGMVKKVRLGSLAVPPSHKTSFADIPRCPDNIPIIRHIWKPSDEISVPEDPPFYIPEILPYRIPREVVEEA